MKKIISEFNKYSFANIIAFIFDLSLLFVLTYYIEMYYILAASISISVGFSINYILNTQWVFKKRKYKNNPLLEYNLMIIISLITSLLNIFLIWIFTELLIFYFMTSKIFSSIITFLLKFSIKKYFLFSLKSKL